VPSHRASSSRTLVDRKTMSTSADNLDFSSNVPAKRNNVSMLN
jgi:hypothetical protein